MKTHSKIVISLLLLLCMLTPMVLSACDLLGSGETIAAESLTMSSTEVTVEVGKTEQLVATVLPANTTDKTVSYTSSAPAIATVDETGKVTAVAVGTTTIIATTANGKTATCAVTVVAAEIPATSVTLDKTEITLAVGGTDTLTATVLPAEATNKSVIYTSSNPAVVTVAANGTVTAVGAGSAAIIAITENGQLATCTVTVSAPAEDLPTEITLSANALELVAGANGTLTATVLPAEAANKTVRYTSSNTAVATVDVDGNITAVAGGTAVIIAATVNGKIATCVVTVVPTAGSVVPATGVTLSATASTLVIGGTATITATVAPQNATDKAVTFTSSNEAVATVNENGVVTAVSAGTVTIIATTANGKFAVCTLSVTEASISATDITLTKNALALAIGETETLTATVLPAEATDKTVSYTSSNPAVATVDANGVVTAQAAGVATIVAVTANGKVATCVVTVASSDIPVTGVTLNNHNLALSIGGSFTIQATVAPATATDKAVTFHSSNESIATVDANGKVTAKAAGSVAIVAITANGMFDTCVVTVSSTSSSSVAVLSITLNHETLALNIDATASLIATVAPTNATNKLVSYISSDPAIATVNGSGVVTAHAAGVATIVAVTANGKVDTCTVTVKSGEIPVESVSLNNTVLYLKVNGTASLSATVLPANATDKAVTFTSSNTSVVTVSAQGAVTAKGVGLATIVATTADGKFAVCTVRVTATVVEATGVTLNNTALNLVMGGTTTATLSATVAPSTATDKTVTYTSSNTAVATVSANGVVTAKAAGVATIIATTANGKIATCTVTVDSGYIAVTGVTLNNTALDLKVNGTSTLTATVAPSTATSKTVTYTSTNTSVATVDSTGKVTAKALGTTTIVATTADGKFAVCTVTVSPTAVTSVTLNSSSLALNVNGTASLTATVNPSGATDKTVTYTSSDVNIATVDSTGKVTAKAAGVAVIVATTANGKIATCTVTVEIPEEPIVPVTDVTLNNAVLDLKVNGTATLTATVAPNNATYPAVTYTSTNGDVATVDSTGKVTAQAVGVATIIATTTNGKFAVCTVSVTPTIVAVTGVTLEGNFSQLEIGATETLFATVAPNNATDKTVTYTSSNPAVATVDASGKVIAKAEGSVTIIATTANGKTATWSFTVPSSYVPVTSVALNSSALDLKVNGTSTLTATVAPSTATNKAVTYTSTNTAIATVDNTGKVTAKAVGAATIVATTADGKFAVCTVRVTATVVEATGVTLNNTALKLVMGGTTTATLSATVAPSTATDKTVTYTSSNTAVATVSANGVVTAKAAGVATIIATTANGKIATCTVTVDSGYIAVTGVTLNNTALNLKVNGTATLSATVVPSNATSKTVTYTSTNTAIATVDSTGKVTAKALGTTTIVATTADGKFAVCTVTVSPTAVTSVTLNKDTLSLSIGGTSTLSATVAPSTASDKSVTYTSANTAVATVDSTGKVTAKAAGTATIVVASANGMVDTCIVTVASSEVPVTGVTLNNSTLDLKVNGTSTLTATVAPSNATNSAVTYTSTNTAIATVDSTGKVTAKAVGTATIIATTTNGKFAVCTVSVTPTVVEATSVALNNSVLDLNLTDKTTATLSATVTPSNANDKAVTYTSSNTAVATVGATGGLVTAKGAGTAVIVATTANGKVATCTVNVASPDILAESVTLNKVEFSLIAKETATLTATVLPANTTNKAVTYTSSNTDVVTVDGNGKITAVAPGMASIVVSTANGKYASCTVVVTELVILPTEILLSKTNNTAIYTGETIELKATVVPVDAKNKTVTFTSSAPSVASVTADGKITGLAKGTATIVATTHNGITAKFTVIVNKAPAYANDLEWVFGMPEDGKLNSSTNVVSSYGVGAMPTTSQFNGTYIGANAFATSCFKLTGLTNPSATSQGGNYYRLDHSNKANYPTNNENIANTRGYQTAGVAVRFCTDATKIALYAEMQLVSSSFKHMPNKGAYGFDVYVGTGTNRTWVATGGNALVNTATVDEEITLPAGYKEVMIYFPQYAGVTKVFIGFPIASKDTTRLCPPAARTNSGNLCFYGTSITQGACSSRAGTSYTNILGRALDIDVRNLGFSGSAVGEQVIAEYIASLKDLSVLVMDYDRNHNNGATGQAALQAAHYPFYKTIRDAQPNLPIVFVTRPIYTAPTAGDIAMRNIVKATYDRAVAEGDTNVYFIDGLYYFTEDMTDMFTVDGTHPNDTGHFYMATKIYPVLKEILDSKK